MKVLCIPESFMCPDCHNTDFEIPLERALSETESLFTCSGCNRVFSQRSGILHALPSAMAIQADANLEYYNSMSAESNNLLLRRAKTRTHRGKFRMISKALELDCDVNLRVLEIGIGLGAHGANVMQLKHSYTGVDISDGLLTSALRNYPELNTATLAAADATQLPFTDGSFDRGFFVATLHHLPEPADGVRELVRVLKPGGRFCFLEPRRFYPTQTLQYLKHPSTEVSAMKMTVRHMRRWLISAGIEDIRITYTIYTPNTPRALSGIYDKIDALCAKLHLHKLAVMMCVYGVKTG